MPETPYSAGQANQGEAAYHQPLNDVILFPVFSVRSLCQKNLEEVSVKRLRRGLRHGISPLRSALAKTFGSGAVRTWPIIKPSFFFRRY